jgi:hypothetical protein
MRKTILAALLLLTVHSFFTYTATASDPPTKGSKEDREEGVRVIRPSGGSIRAVEFVDSTGRVTKRINATREFAKKDGKRHIQEIRIQTAPPSAPAFTLGAKRYARFVLVMESERFENDRETIRETGKAWNIDNALTLYDSAGRALFRKTGLKCFPVALSESGNRVACLLSPPQGDSDPIYPPNSVLFIFSGQGELVRKLEDPSPYLHNVKLSPSGVWLAYVNQAPIEEREVKLMNLVTGRLVTVPVDKKGYLRGYAKLLDNGDLIGFELIYPRDSDATFIRQSDGTLKVERRTKILYKMEP